VNGLGFHEVSALEISAGCAAAGAAAVLMEFPAEFVEFPAVTIKWLLI